MTLFLDFRTQGVGGSILEEPRRGRPGRWSR